MSCVRRALSIMFSLSLVGAGVLAASRPAAADAGTGDATVLAFGSAPFKGSTEGTKLSAPIVGMAATPSGAGYWLVASDGGVFGFGDAGFHGSTGGMVLNRPIVGMAASPSGAGYWLVASDGGVFGFGDAGFHGSTGGMVLNRPIVGMAASPSGAGYWLVASDGGVFGFGDAGFHGSTGGMVLNRPIVGMAASPSGAGYWLVASDGGIFAFGDAPFEGSAGGTPLRAPVTSMASSATGAGYWLAAADGGVFGYGDAPFAGSAAGRVPTSKVALAVARAAGGGYWILQAPAPYGPAAVGASVTAVQERLNDLGYWLPVTGRVDFTTVQALYALEKVAGLPRVGAIGAAERAALERGVRPAPRQLADGIEVDKGRQIVLVIRGGTVIFTFNTSTGSGQRYSSGGGTAVAVTPEGHFSIYNQINGQRTSALGQLWRPKYFTGGYALHGSPSIPPFPASHGCVRLSNPAINKIWDSGLAPLGTPVFVYH